jgi:hypothetical protein
VAADLLGAVVDVWAADLGAGSLAVLVPGGLWLEEVAPGTDLPHAALFDEGGAQDLYSEGDALESARLRLEIFAARDVTLPLTDPGRPASAVGRIMRRAKDVLNAGRLAVTGWSHYDLRVADRGRLRAVEQRDPEGRRVYQGVLRVFAAVSRAHG